MNSNAVCNVDLTTAQIGAPVEIRIDNQLAGRIVVAGDLKCIGITIDQPISASYLDLLAINDLIDIGRIVHYLAPIAGQADVEGAGLVNLKALDAVVADTDL